MVRSGDRTAIGVTAGLRLRISTFELRAAAELAYSITVEYSTVAGGPVGHISKLGNST